MDLRAFNVLSLCSGAGGLELGLRLAVPEARVRCYVEREAFDCAIMVKRMQEGILDEAPIWSDISTFNTKPWRGKIHCVTAGYPCQPISVAGHHLGKEDPRWLWPRVRDIIDDVRPVFVFCENVENHLNQGFPGVFDDLRELGYGVEAGVFSAREVGAPHKRRRLFFLGYAEGGRSWTVAPEGREGEDREPRDDVVRNDVQNEIPPSGIPLFPPGRKAPKTWKAVLMQCPALEPCLPRMDDELAKELDGYKEGHETRLYALGNGVVPTCAGYAFLVLLSRMLGGTV